jgi:triosephosphate isomerase
MNRKQLAANWKMNLSLSEVYALMDILKNGIREAQGNLTRPTLLAVPAPYIFPVGNEVAGYDGLLEVAAQNIHHEEKGAYTGESSATHVKDAGARWTLLGHSERRQYQNETNSLLSGKVRLALMHGLRVVYCVGETLADREASNTLPVVGAQIKEVLYGLSPEQMESVVVAYEPVWAIGTGKVATPEQAQEVHAYIRSLVRGHWGTDVSNTLCIQYGGSVTAANAEGLFAQPDIDGALVGGASLKASDFLSILTALSKA